MGEARASVGPFQIPVRWLWRAPLWLIRSITGANALQKDFRELRQHVVAVTDVTYLLLVRSMGDMSEEQRERVLRAVSNFTLVRESLSKLRPTGNPLTGVELQRIRQYVDKAEKGHRFSPEEALEFRQLADRVAKDYSGQDWVTELLKLALFIFALYALAKLLSPEQQGQPGQA